MSSDEIGRGHPAHPRYTPDMPVGGSLYAAPDPECGHVTHDGHGPRRQGLLPPGGGWQACPVPVPESHAEALHSGVWVTGPDDLSGPSEGSERERGTTHHVTCPECGQRFSVDVP